MDDGDEEIMRLRQQLESVESIRQVGINKRNGDMNNQGYVDTKKHPDCVRILSLNPRGFGLNNKEKMEMMLIAAQKY